MQRYLLLVLNSFYLFVFVWEYLTNQTVLFKVLANNFLYFCFVLKQAKTLLFEAFKAHDAVFWIFVTECSILSLDSFVLSLFKS